MSLEINGKPTKPLWDGARGSLCVDVEWIFIAVLCLGRSARRLCWQRFRSLLVTGVGRLRLGLWDWSRLERRTGTLCNWTGRAALWLFQRQCLPTHVWYSIVGFNSTHYRSFHTILRVVWLNQQCHSTERLWSINQVKGRSHQAQLKKNVEKNKTKKYSLCI